MKKKNVFKVGDRVGDLETYDGDDKLMYKLRYDEDEEPCYGVVTDVTSKGLVIVQYDDSRQRRDSGTAVDPSHFMLESKIKKEWSRLEKEFDLVSKEIEAKMTAAGKLLKEANKLAKKSGRSLDEMYDAIDPLMDAMDACGWRTSSFGC